MEDGRARAAEIDLFIIWYIRYIWFSTVHILEVQVDMVEIEIEKRKGKEIALG